MSFTTQRMQTHWPKTREFIKKTWPKFTNVELDRINGNYDLFFKYYNEFYNDFPKGEAKVRDLFKRFYNSLDAAEFTS